MILSNTSKESEYAKWLEILSEETQENLVTQKANQINMNSKADRIRLFEAYKKNRRTIGFWLTKCVFPINLKQYSKSICSSAFDLADVERSIGFSGTKDNRFVFPEKLSWKPCQTPTIKGTDGQMMQLLIDNTKEICVIEEDKMTLWQRFISLALQKKVGCIIDVGALCVGKSLKK